MMKKPTTTATIKPAFRPPPASETKPERFDRVLSRSQFKPLKAVIDHLRLDSESMSAALIATNTYQMFLRKLGWRMVVVKQLHEQDCYTRLGPNGGVRAVVPLHDTATYSTLITLVNFDDTVTTTSKSVDFYDEQLAAFKNQLMNKSGDAG